MTQQRAHGQHSQGRFLEGAVIGSDEKQKGSRLEGKRENREPKVEKETKLENRIQVSL